MNLQSPLQEEILFHIGPVPVSNDIVTTWAVMAFLVLVSWAGMRKQALRPGAFQAALEIVVETLEKQISDILKRDGSAYLPLLGTLFLFIVTANLTAVMPGLKPPTARLETNGALAAIVFLAVHYFGVRSRGLKGYLGHYAEPSLFLVPLNILEEVTRVFSLMIRLTGNIMSHEFVIAIIVFLAGLFVPIPFMILGIMIGIIQAYIFTVLATVFIAAALDHTERKSGEQA
jgi:F-type H+-transporting ATPase subunit a